MYRVRMVYGRGIRRLSERAESDGWMDGRSFA